MRKKDNLYCQYLIEKLKTFYKIDMGLFNFFNNSKYLESEGNVIIDNVINLYGLVKEKYLNRDKHFWLMGTYLSNLGDAGADIESELSISTSYSETLINACLPESDCIRSLGLYILYKSRKDIIARFPQFNTEYTQLTKKVYELATNHPDKFIKKYKIENPDSIEDKSVQLILKSSGYKL